MPECKRCLGDNVIPLTGDEMSKANAAAAWLKPCPGCMWERERVLKVIYKASQDELTRNWKKLIDALEQEFAEGKP